jgi:hypothetical protein
MFVASWDGNCRFRLPFAELFIAAYLSGDKQLLFAIEQGYDLHSYSSFLIIPEMVRCRRSAEPVENHLLKKLQT